MSFKAKLRQGILNCLIHKCDREYDRTYQYAQKRLSYSNLISILESKEKEEMRDLGVSIVGFLSKWDESVDIDSLMETSKKSDLICLCEQECYMHVSAKQWVGEWFNSHPETLILYGDEDVVDKDGQRSLPWLKPEWSPNLFLNVHYFGGLVAIRSKLLMQILSRALNENRQFTLRQLVFELCKEAGGYGLRGASISHVDKVLCHQPNEQAYEKFLHCQHLTYQEEGGRDFANALVSIVIPSKDQVQMLERNLRSLERTVDLAQIEVIVVDNGSTDENRNRIEKLIQGLTIRVKYIYSPMEFNFSFMCNKGAKESAGEVLLFLNDDIEADCQGWLESMMLVASRPYVGCVGAKLLYPDSDKIQHAGVVNLPLGPVHKLQMQEDAKCHYFERNKQDQDCMAVTGACLMIRRELFEEVGGFDEELAVTFNDVDLCYKLYAKGYHNVILNSIFLYHYESVSRGMDVSAEKRNRLVIEREKLWQRHALLQKKDPYYHKYLNQSTEDMNIRPAPEEYMKIQQSKVQARPWKKKEGRDLRRHEGVVLTIERKENSFLLGYLFMVGDDNACYEKHLVFRNVSTQDRFWCRLNQTLREDLKENLPDQKNVALSGFDVRVLNLPKGEYEIIGIAHNKISGVSYYKETQIFMSMTEE